VPIRRIRFIIRQAIADADLRVLIREIIQRFCSRSDHARVCARFALSSFELDAIISTIIIRIRTGQNVDIEVPDDTGADENGPVKRQAQTSFGQLLVMAANDPDATQGYDMSAADAPDDGPSDAPSTPKNGSANVVASVFFLVLFLALF
jgi:hypothetical protein